MKLPIYQLDAFTDRVFGGNPAAVVVMREWLDDSILQAIAAENNLSETAFVIPGADHSRLRWFTPRLEMDLCGHATLATAHVLFDEHFPAQTDLRFETKSGSLAVSRREELLFLDFPSRPGQSVAITERIIEALGTEPVAVFLARDLMVVLETEAQVRGFAPDYPAIEALE
ncbi:MAG: PhzF family phenazine biosynthesis protein, partial [Nitrosomonas ureae]